MNEKEMWAEYTKKHPEAANAHYEAWQYGSDDPDLLARLTLCGQKTAAASAFPSFEYENCPLPVAGLYNIVLDTAGNALCIIRDTKVSIVPFIEVSAEHAYKEGEGDRSLSFWRRVHEQVFRMELKEIGQEFTENMPVVLEEYEFVWPETAK